jgi:hypothetical protein
MGSTSCLSRLSAYVVEWLKEKGLTSWSPGETGRLSKRQESQDATSWISPPFYHSRHRMARHRARRDCPIEIPKSSARHATLR